MIRKFPCKSRPASWPPHAARTFSYGAAFIALATIVVSPIDAFGQTGFLTSDPNVSVDMSVLEELGPASTVAGRFLSSGTIPQPAVSFPPPTPPVSHLTGPLAARRFNLDPSTRPQASAPPRSTITQPPPVTAQPPAPVAAAPVAPQRAAPAPAPAEVRAAPAATPPPTRVPPAPTPPPAPAVAAPKATSTAAPEEPATAPKEEVDVAPPPPPSATATAQPEPAPVEDPTEPETPAPAANTALTPSPAGPAPAQTAPPAPAVQTASAPPVRGQEPSFRVLFDDGSAKISDAARTPLEELSKKMQESEDLRVQLLAYAGGTSETASQARRLSLSRALAVRSFLIGQGVRSTRMDVRALGNKAESGPADRVDAVLVER